eukprot:SAG31_NODE_2197_length_6216_cov_4.189962_2_plen_232_part_00
MEITDANGDWQAAVQARKTAWGAYTMRADQRTDLDKENRPPGLTPGYEYLQHASISTGGMDRRAHAAKFGGDSGTGNMPVPTENHAGMRNMQPIRPHNAAQGMFISDNDICRRLQSLGLPPQQQQQQQQQQQKLQLQLADRYQPPPGGFGLDADEVYASMLERERKDAGECRCTSVLYPHALTSSPVVAQCALLCFVVSFSCDMNLGYLTYRTVVVDWMCEVRNRRSYLSR